MPAPARNAAILACSIAVGLGSAASPALAERPSGATDGAVLVTARVPGERAEGSGTIVAMNGTNVRILTADHVARFGALTVTLPNGVHVPAQILSEFSKRDLAVIDADVDPIVAPTLHVAPIGSPRSNEPVHVWGGADDAQDLETGAMGAVGADLPDGPANGRVALGCTQCRQGDSGGGVFNVRGELVGVYVGYFIMDSGPNVSVAALPAGDVIAVAHAEAPSTLAIANVSP